MTNPTPDQYRRVSSFGEFSARLAGGDVQLSSFGEVTLMREIVESLNDLVDPRDHLDVAMRLTEAEGQIWGLSTLVISRPFSTDEDVPRARKIAHVASRIALEAFPEAAPNYAAVRAVLLDLQQSLDTLASAND